MGNIGCEVAMIELQEDFFSNGCKHSNILLHSMGKCWVDRLGNFADFPNGSKEMLRSCPNRFQIQG